MEAIPKAADKADANTAVPPIQIEWERVPKPQAPSLPPRMFPGIDMSAGNISEFDKSGRLTAVTFPDGTQRTFEYVPKIHAPIKILEPNGDKFLFTGSGFYERRIWTHRGDDYVTDNKRYAAKASPTGALVFTDYDYFGVELPDKSTATFDHSGELVSYRYPDGKQVRYSYDNDGRIHAVVDVNNKIWLRGADEMYHAVGGGNIPTGEVTSGDKLMPPLSDTQVFGKDQTSSLSYWRDLAREAVFGRQWQTDGPVDLSAGVQQGALGDCYFLAALAGLAKTQPDAIRDMIKDNKNGSFTVTFPGDKDHPITVEAPTAQETALYAADNNGAWAAILEKAHRYLTGKISGDNGGDTTDALALLTGKECLPFALHKPTNFSEKLENWFEGNREVVPREALSMLLAKAIADRQPIAVETDENTHLVSTHVFTVMNYDAAAETVTLRNPWGYNHAVDVAKVPSFHDNGNGVFTVSLADLQKEFHAIVVPKELLSQ